MANIEESLETIMNIDGAVGAALVDYQSGMTLGAIGGGKIDMELAGAGTTEVVRAKKKIIDQLKLDEVIEDILVSLESQYHLVRVFHENDNVFTYLVLDSEKANLALARMQLQEIDNNLELGLAGESESDSGRDASNGQSTSQSTSRSQSDNRSERAAHRS
jgi:predicted regulator of Ras-like GTPase activity (Roadblock/LC7/MglB family)